MEYLSTNDFFLKFKPQGDGKKETTKYTLLEASDNFYSMLKIKPKKIIGLCLCEISRDYGYVLELQDYYFSNLTKASRKFKMYNKELNLWYFINIYHDEQNHLVLTYTDITLLEEELQRQKQDILDHNLIMYSYRDKLTDLYTKDFFDVELHRLDSERQLPISIIMGDLNGLKLINDAFGHRMGDRAIRMVGNVLKESFRKEDIVSRIGGDEFLILLPKTSEQIACRIIDDLKRKLSEKTLEFLPLSVSFGLSTKTDKEENIEATIKSAEEKMYFLKLEESKAAKLFTIQYLKKKLAKISFETKGHILRLMEVSLLIAKDLNLSEIEKQEIKSLCEFHDIGKIGVSHDILLKEGQLSQEEWAQMKRHSEIGYHIIRSAKETLAIDELILVHHERWDGSGYPKQVKGLEIPLAARIFSIADAYVAMVEGRPYQNRISHEYAVEEIKKSSGTQFDPEIVKTFEKIIDNISYIGLLDI